MSKKKILDRKYFVGALLLLIWALILILFGQRQAHSPSSDSTSQQSASQAKKEPAFDTTRYSLTDPASIWVIVNKKRPLNPLAYAPTDLTDVGNNQQMRAEAAQALSAMFAAAKAAGHTLSADSGYRSYNMQETIYNNFVRRDGQALTDTYSAKPGHSEHQTGWGVDVGGDGCHIEDCFAATPSGKWVAENAYKYGFIVRYVSGKEAITGYKYEPWHIRYVGIELATEMQRKGFTTLEEFFNLN